MRDKDGEIHEFRLNAKTRLKADKKSELGGRPEILLSDFRIGHSVKVTYLTQDRSVTQLRLRKSG